MAKPAKLYLIYFGLQLKAFGILIPRLLLVLILSGFLAVGAGIAGSHALYKDSGIQKVPIALVLPENDRLVNLAFSFLEGMDSVRDTCLFYKVSREEAYSLFDKGQVFSIILIPDSFVEQILSGENLPATVILPKESNLEALLFKTLADSGVSLLSTAQAGIYAVDDVLIRKEHWESIPVMEKELNQLYLAYSLNRSAYFKNMPLSATGAWSVLEFYSASGLIFILLFSGTSAYEYFKTEGSALRLCLKRLGLSLFSVQVIKLTAFSLVFSSLIFLAEKLLYLMPLPVRLSYWDLEQFFSLFILLFSISSFFLLVSKSSSQASGAVLTISVLSIGSLFLAGGFLPSVFLPEKLRALGQLLPASNWLNLAGGLLFGTASPADLYRSFFTGTLFLIASTLIETVKSFPHQKGIL